MSVTFRNNRFPNPEALIGLINKKSGIMQVTGDQKVVVRQTLPQSKRVNAARKLVDEIVALL
jgi:transcription-repair coupling factor (superfamily II helicase)